jgi:hypothetical protein
VGARDAAGRARGGKTAAAASRALTFPIARRPRSKKNMMPRNVKRKPKAVRPRPISADLERGRADGR